MKTLVVYSSQTGNTEKLAQAAFEVLPDEKEIYGVADAPDTADYDLICVCFWLQAGKPDPKTTKYLSNKVANEMDKGRKVFLVATHGAAAASDHAAAAMKYAREELLPGAKVVGEFNCPGEVNPVFLEKATAKPEPPVWLKDAPQAVGHPDDNDIKQLQELVKQAVSGL